MIVKQLIEQLQQMDEEQVLTNVECELTSKGLMFYSTNNATVGQLLKGLDTVDENTEVYFVNNNIVNEVVGISRWGVVFKSSVGELIVRKNRNE